MSLYRSFPVAAAAFALVAPLAAHAAPANASKVPPSLFNAPLTTVPNHVRENIDALYVTRYGEKPTEIHVSPIDNSLYQVVANGRVTYVDASARYLIEGVAIDAKTGANLNEAIFTRAAAKIIPTLNLQNAVKVHEGGRKIIYTIEDMNCGYCKKLAPELAKLKDVTVYTFPVEFLGAASGERAKQMWCSPNRQVAWRSMMANQPVPVADSCDATAMLKANTALAKALGVAGTPAIFFADGSRIPGYVNAERIEQALARQND